MQYIRNSLELHLFFGRIMKEHAFFLLAGFTPADAEYAEKARFYMKGFEDLLCQALELSDGLVSKAVLCSGEIVTAFTANAERQTECFTGIPINKRLTERALGLGCGEKPCMELRGKVRQLNRTAMQLLDGLITFKEEILGCVLQCRMFTMNYPLLIEHILREAKLYRKYVAILERGGDPGRSMQETEHFWNQIMMEHAQFIRGLLDPCECELIDAADGFAKEFCQLLQCSRDAHSRANSLEKAKQIRDFKAAGTQGISECKIRSIILPLLADHVLREANHYIRLLER